MSAPEDAVDFGGELSLIFFHDGHAELQEGGALVWSSEDDSNFVDEVGEETLDTDDAEKVLEFLIDEGFLEDEQEASTVEVSSEDDENDESESGGADDEDEVIDLETHDGVHFQ